MSAPAQIHPQPPIQMSSSHNSSGAVSFPAPAVGSDPTTTSAITPAGQPRKPRNKQPMKGKKLKPSTSRTVNPTSTGVPAKKAGRTEEEKRAKHLLKRMQNAEKRDSRSQLVFTAARSTIAILQKHGISCAMFGSLACKLYGDFREPKDVDVLVFQPQTDSSTPLYSDEELKKLIADADPKHYLIKLPRNPEAPYRILYYRDKQVECKVDILIPGSMHLPNLLSPPPPPSHIGSPTTTTSSSPNRITTISGIPLIPFSLLLLHKLQGWSDHRSAPEKFKQHKQHQDAADIRKLLAMSDLIKPLQQARPWTDNELFSPEFQVLTKERVKDYCKEFPMRAESWKSLGFETE